MYSANKTVCVIFSPECRKNVVSQQFPILCLSSQAIQYVPQFRSLVHVIDNQLTDNENIKREIRNLFMRFTNLLQRRFNKCAIPVKSQLFRSYILSLPIGLYDNALWRYFQCDI
jgi:hypothetical protein